MGLSLPLAVSESGGSAHVLVVVLLLTTTYRTTGSMVGSVLGRSVSEVHRDQHDVFST